jgi:hypothetical protein
VQRIDAEHVPLPGVKLDEKPIHEIVAGALESDVPSWISELPLASPKLSPRRSHHACRCAIAEIDYDQPARSAVPAPGDKIEISVVSRPAGSFAQSPAPGPERWVGQSLQQ